MEYITYYTRPFDSVAAERGNLCVVTRYGFNGSQISTDSSSFIQACICTALSPIDFTVVVNGVTCLFDDKGYPKNVASKDYQLFMGSSDIQVEQYGTAIRRARKIVTTRSADGTVSTEEKEYESGESKNILISNMTPRDNFALQALRAIIPTLPDLKNIGDTERYYYCDLAYKWAATMMDRAAQVRATFVDETESSTTEEAEVGELETNTEKLLNNLIATLEKTQQVTIDGQRQVVSDRVVIPELTNTIKQSLHHTPEDEDDDQLVFRWEDMQETLNIMRRDIKKAIDDQRAVLNSSFSALTTAINNQTTVLTKIKEAIEGLQPEPEPESNDNTEEE